MLKLKIKPEKLALITAFCFWAIFCFGYYAWGVVYYPPVAALGVGDIKSSHIRDGTIVNVDVSSTAAIAYSKLDLTGRIVNADVSSTAGIVISKLEGATTSWFMTGEGGKWTATSTANARTSMGLGSMALQASNSVAISGGTITGITDLATADGGTGQSWNAVATGSIPYFSSGGVMSTLSAGTSTYFLQSQGTNTAPAWAPSVAITFVDTQAFSGTTPTDWTDLDLSSVIGAGPALVLLRSYAAVANIHVFREDGETADVPMSSSYGTAGTSGAWHNANATIAYLWVLAPASSTIEWKSNVAQANATIRVRAYQK